MAKNQMMVNVLTRSWVGEMGRLRLGWRRLHAWRDKNGVYTVRYGNIEEQFDNMRDALDYVSGKVAEAIEDIPAFDQTGE